MNNARRKTLDGIVAALQQAKADWETYVEALAERLETIKGDIAGARDEEQDGYDNMPESFQNGEKGEKAQAAVDAMDEAVNAIDEVINSFESNFEDIVASIETAKE